MKILLILVYFSVRVTAIISDKESAKENGIDEGRITQNVHEIQTKIQEYLGKSKVELEDWFDYDKKNEMNSIISKLAEIEGKLHDKTRIFNLTQKEIQDQLNFRQNDGTFESSKPLVKEMNDKLDKIELELEEEMKMINVSKSEHEIAEVRVKESLTVFQGITKEDRELNKDMETLNETIIEVDEMIKGLNQKLDDHLSTIDSYEVNVSSFIARLIESRRQITEIEKLILSLEANGTQAVGLPASPTGSKHCIKSVKTKSARGNNIAFILVSD